MANSINHLLGQTKVLHTNAPASVHLYLNKSDSDPKTFQLSVVNTSSSSQRPFRDLIPVENITVELPFPVASAEVIYNPDNEKVKIKYNTLIISKLEEFISLRIISE
jgi:hypothetical protein